VVEYRYEPESNLLVVTVSGVVTNADFQDARFPDVPADTLELMDLGGCTGTEITTSEVRRIASVDLQRPDRISRMAIVATQDVAYGLARMYQTLSSDMKTEVQIFRDRASARAWLGLD
jgi:hypothetical protein